MFAVCVPAPVTRLPGSASGTCFAGSHSPWSPPFAPQAPLQLPPPQTAPQSGPLCSPASQLLWRSPTSHARTSSATAPHLPDADQVDTWPVVRRRISQVPTRSFCACCGPRPRRDDNGWHSGIGHVAFDHEDSLRSRDFIISWLNPTPHARAVYALCSALPPPHATLASRRPAMALPASDLHRLIAPALPGAFLHSITSSARASSVGGTSRPSTQP